MSRCTLQAVDEIANVEQDLFIGVFLVSAEFYDHLVAFTLEEQTLLLVALELDFAFIVAPYNSVFVPSILLDGLKVLECLLDIVQSLLRF